MFKRHLKPLFLLFSFVLCSNTLWAQFTIPSKPQKNMYVYDYAALLNQQQISDLQNKLYKYDDSTSTQILVVIIDDLKGEDISMLSTKWAQEWGVGGKKEDNGILILLKKDKTGPGGQIDIATGYGIEYRMTDRMTKQIINRDVLPNFKQQNYYQGLNQAVDSIIAILSGEFEGEGYSDQEASWFPLLLMLFIIFIIILSKKDKGGKNNGGRNGKSPSFLDMLILSNMGSSGGSSYRGGSFGGGGFSGGSFGGGSFGGGGAGGRW